MLLYRTDIDMTTFAIPMFIHVDIDDSKIESIPEDVVLDNVAFDRAIENLIREELLTSCKNVENMVEFSIFIDDIPYQDHYYEG
jgi:hypothetical protein